MKSSTVIPIRRTASEPDVNDALEMLIAEGITERIGTVYRTCDAIFAGRLTSFALTMTTLVATAVSVAERVLEEFCADPATKL